MPPTRPNERWSIDFAHDTLGHGRTFRAPAVVGDSTRERLAIAVDTSLRAKRVCAEPDQIAGRGRYARTIVWDSGSEFASLTFDRWAHQRSVAPKFIQPGRRVQNAFAESFNGRLRDECLNETWFWLLAEAQVTIEQCAGSPTPPGHTAASSTAPRRTTPTDYAASQSLPTLGQNDWNSFGVNVTAE